MSNSLKRNVEKVIEKGLFSSRWLMAPIYIGLVGGLILLLVSFFQELVHLFAGIPHLTQSEVILGILSLIDLSLAGNLLLIVIFSGYENFVSKIDTTHHVDQPDWKGNVDFASLKLKLIASMVAISGIHLLKVFMETAKTADRDLMWMLVIHGAFILSGVLLAVMDYVAAKTKALKD
ncbi:MAG: TIGR00645 family protein [Alphaproteobacteria bacterium]|nr:TIGR00645 family protein [Alphaproteobacteria bacterium]